MVITMEIEVKFKPEIYSRNVLAKARKLVRLNKIEQLDSNTWIVNKIRGYNHNTYIVTNKNGIWECNCQANRQEGKECSHIVAVKIYLNKISEEGY